MKKLQLTNVGDSVMSMAKQLQQLSKQINDLQELKIKMVNTLRCQNETIQKLEHKIEGWTKN